ncbi:hypothetical protein KUTeg_009743, partial [Tegillarca granosa]
MSEKLLESDQDTGGTHNDGSNTDSHLNTDLADTLHAFNFYFNVKIFILHKDLVVVNESFAKKLKQHITTGKNFIRVAEKSPTGSKTVSDEKRLLSFENRALRSMKEKKRFQPNNKNSANVVSRATKPTFTTTWSHSLQQQPFRRNRRKEQTLHDNCYRCNQNVNEEVVAPSKIQGPYQQLQKSDRVKDNVFDISSALFTVCLGPL